MFHLTNLEGRGSGRVVRLTRQCVHLRKPCSLGTIEGSACRGRREKSNMMGKEGGGSKGEKREGNRGKRRERAGREGIEREREIS